MATRIVSLKSGFLTVATCGLMSVATFSNAASASLLNTAASLPPMTVLASADVDQSEERSDKADRHADRSHYTDRSRHASDKTRYHDAKRFKRDMILMPGVGFISPKVLQSLELTDAQNALLDEARQAHKALQQERRTLMKQAFQTFDAQLADGKLDPRANIMAMQKAEAALALKQKDIQEKWLAVWDSLQPGQQAKIVAYLKEHQRRSDSR